MEISVVGLNHRQAPVELRERLAVPSGRLSEALARFRTACPVSESVLLSTCNRVEVYALANGTPVGAESVARYLADFHGVERSAFEGFLYHQAGVDAVRHLFRVAAGMESMVLGETQILGQVKDAYLAAKTCRATGRVFNPLFQRALNVAKLVHERTGLGRRKVSVPSVAADFLEKVFQDLSAKTLLLVGAGEVGEAMLRHLLERGVTRVIVCTRQIEHARALAEPIQGKAVLLELLPDYLPEADIVVTCTASSAHVLTTQAVEEAVRRRRGQPVFLLDLSVPRNVHPGAGDLDNVYLYNIDDLESIVRQNLEERSRELDRCETLVEAEVSEFMGSLKLLDLSPIIARLTEDLHVIGREELARALDRLRDLSPEERVEVENLVRRVVNKILHQPISTLKEEAKAGEGVQFVEAIKRIFRLRF
ncbi:MAG: glutamyl-tRNA reductase [Planctomycetes bacterium]|nr:glutamyl-tRNA reductase [Planctomycetota bacterium]